MPRLGFILVASGNFEGEPMRRSGTTYSPYSWTRDLRAHTNISARLIGQKA
jgi:hypothetical protein